MDGKKYSITPLKFEGKVGREIYETMDCHTVFGSYSIGRDKEAYAWRGKYRWTYTFCDGYNEGDGYANTIAECKAAIRAHYLERLAGALTEIK